MITLKKASCRKLYEVVELNKVAPLKIRRRLCDLGLTSGQKVKLVRKSLLGKVLLIEVRGYTLSVRADIAEAVIVK